MKVLHKKLEASLREKTIAPSRRNDNDKIVTEKVKTLVNRNLWFGSGLTGAVVGDLFWSRFSRCGEAVGNHVMHRIGFPATETSIRPPSDLPSLVVSVV